MNRPNYEANRNWFAESQAKARDRESKAKQPLKRSKIHPRSKKATERQQAYFAVRDPFMKQHPYCECCALTGSRTPATDLHHKRGREGTLLTDTRYFCALCRTCHDYIHRNPIWAKENGFLGSKFRPIEEENAD